MDFETFKQHVVELDFGKHLPDAIYLHESAIDGLPAELATLLSRVNTALQIGADEWNILKLSKRDFKYSLLSYPDFLDYPYPALANSLAVDLSKKAVRRASYAESENPPILHRRELFLLPDNDLIGLYKQFTKEGEDIGLYEKTNTIGTVNGWNRAIRKSGHCLDEGGHIIPLALSSQADAEHDNQDNIRRDRTAIARDKLSTPLFLLAKRGYLSGDYTVHDYGCGKGDDLRELEAHGVDCIGWDPVFRPDAERANCDIVNLGFVINVIEDQDERKETLIKAFSFAEKFIIISAMLGNESVYERFKPYKDGVITKSNTFQKYFFQGELQQYIETTLEMPAIALAPGVFLVFKDKLEEQMFFLQRQQSRHQWRQLSRRKRVPASAKELRTLFTTNKDLINDFWETTLDLGRMPGNDEFEGSGPLRQVVGSHNKALDICLSEYGEEPYETAQARRRNDLLVYFALGHFGKRPAYRRMPQSLQRDVKALFGSYSEARDHGKELLFSMGDIEVINSACVEAHQQLPASVLNEGHDLIFHSKFLEHCPAALRVYVGCATQLYGELDEIDLVKAHIRSGKVTLMVHEGFDEKPIPLLIERIKIKLIEQDIDFFDYIGQYEPQPLVGKSRFIDISFSDYSKQGAFDKKLKALLSQNSYDGYFSTNALAEVLTNNKLCIKDYNLAPL